MKKKITILAICSLLLTACGQVDDTESKPVTTTTTISESSDDPTESTSAKEEKDTSEATTTIKSSQTVSETSKLIDTTVTTTKKSNSSGSSGNSSQVQNNSAQNNSGQENNYQPVQNDPQPDNSTSDNKPQNNDPTPPTTTAKPAVTNPPTTTTTKPQTTVPQTEPPAPEPNDQVVDVNAVSDQMWVFLECYPIDYSGMYNAGKQLSNDGSDISKARAVSNYAYNQGGRNCIEYALNAYFLAKGAGLECYIARSSKYDWYGHVANVIKLDGEWYYMEPQGNIVGSPTTYAAGGTASDGSVISYPDGLDVVTDIYDNQINVKISENWYE